MQMMSIELLLSFVSVCVALYFGLRHRNTQKALRALFDAIYRQSQSNMRSLGKLVRSVRDNEIVPGDVKAILEQIETSVSTLDQTLFETKETLYHRRSPEKIENLYRAIESKLKEQIEEEIKPDHPQPPKSQILEKTGRRQWSMVVLWIFIGFVLLYVFLLVLGFISEWLTPI